MSSCIGGFVVLTPQHLLKDKQLAFNKCWYCVVFVYLFHAEMMEVLFCYSTSKSIVIDIWNLVVYKIF